MTGSGTDLRQKSMLVVSHAPSPNTRALTDAIARGATHPEISGVSLSVLSPFDCNAEQLLAADGVVLATTENFGYMSGALKDFFDRIYYPCLERTEGLPYALVVRAGNDGCGARSSVERIVTGLRWRPAAEPLLAVGEFRSDYIDRAEELGMTLAAGLEAGVF